MAIAAGANTEMMVLQLDPPGRGSFPEGLFDGAERKQQGSLLVSVTCIDVLNNASVSPTPTCHGQTRRSAPRGCGMLFRSAAGGEQPAEGSSPRAR